MTLLRLIIYQQSWGKAIPPKNRHDFDNYEGNNAFVDHDNDDDDYDTDFDVYISQLTGAVRLIAVVRAILISIAPEVPGASVAGAVAVVARVHG